VTRQATHGARGGRKKNTHTESVLTQINAGKPDHCELRRKLDVQELVSTCAPDLGAAKLWMVRGGKGTSSP
jgi:hypothetical protein